MCLWVEGSRSESSWQLLTAKKHKVTRKGPTDPRVNMKSRVFRSFPEKSREVWSSPELRSYDIEWEESGGLSPKGTQPDRQSLR